MRSTGWEDSKTTEMDRIRKVGRNDPCPCGSGKKYKKCCGAAGDDPLAGAGDAVYFRLNKEIAYRGKVGRQREAFCRHFIEKNGGFSRRRNMHNLRSLHPRVRL